VAWPLIIAAATFGLGIFALLYKIGVLVGSINTRLDNLERQHNDAIAVGLAERNGYAPRPRRRG